MRFADYFGRAFSSVSGAQFPWLKTFKESTVAKIVDVSCFCSFLFYFNSDYDFETKVERFCDARDIWLFVWYRILNCMSEF